MSEETTKECEEIAKSVAKDWEAAYARMSEPHDANYDAYEDEDSFYYKLDNDVLDIRVNCFLCGGKESFRHAELCVGWGGPNVYLNCGEHQVEVYWGCSVATWPLPFDVCDEINDYVYETWLYAEKERD